MNRREVLILGGAALATAALPKSACSFSNQLAKLEDWESIRDQFELTHDVVNMSGFFLASHPSATQ